MEACVVVYCGGLWRKLAVEACGAICCGGIWMRLIVDACGVVLLWIHMAARRLIVEVCGVSCCGDIWRRLAVDACGMVCCRCIWRRFVVETCGVGDLCGDGLQRHVEVCRGGMWSVTSRRLAEEACGQEVSRGGMRMRFCHVSVSRGIIVEAYG